MINEIITNLLTLDDTPIFWIKNSQEEQHKRYIVFNYTTYPSLYSNDEVICQEVEYTYHIVFKNEDVKKHLKFCKELRKKTMADKIMHYFDGNTNSYHAVYEATFPVWSDELEDKN